jgi:ribose/xylose/arabinose/galactoside ABC-type transport system permease subunit
MSVKKRKIFAYAVAAFFAATALQVCAQRMTTMLPGTVKNFELPNFNENSGAKEWELFGDEAS